MRDHSLIISALALTVVNILVYYASTGLGYLVFAGVASSWLLAGLGGYIAGRSRHLILVVIEGLALIILTVITAPPLTSSQYVVQSAAIIVTAYLLGVVSGASLSTRTPTTHHVSLTKVWDVRSTLPIFIGGLGVASAVRGVCEYFACPLLLPQSSAGLYAMIVAWVVGALLTSALLAGYEMNFLTSLFVTGLVTLLSPLTLPIPVVLEGLKHRDAEIGVNECIALGEVLKVIRKQSKGRKAPCLTFKMGENNHMIIAGSSGTGKTQAAKRLIDGALKRNINVLVLDVHGEYASLSAAKVINPAENPINLLARFDKSPAMRAEEVADLIASAFRLGNVQKSVLQHMIIYAYKLFDNPKVTDLLDIASDPRAPEYLGFSKDVIRSLIPYLKTLSGLESKVEWLEPVELSEGLIVADLSRVESLSLQVVYLEALVHMLFNYRKSRPQPTLVVVEEAHRFITRNRVSILTKLFREGRKFGINVIAITQEPYSLEPAALNNCGYILSLQLTEERATSMIARLMAGGNEKYFKKIRNLLAELSKFECLLWTRNGDVFLLKLPISLSS